MTRFLFCFLAVFAFLSSPAAADEDRGLDIYWVDVEGGAATLMVTPQGESILVDAGNPGRRDAARIFELATKVAKIRQIDHLVVTHYHGDHFGGVADLARLMPIKTLYDNGDFPEGREKPDAAYRAAKVERRAVISPGDGLDLKEGAGPRLAIRCLAARQKTIAAAEGAPANDAACAAHRPKDRDGSDNANSVVLLVCYGDFRFFDAGDLTWNLEARLVCPTNLVGKVDVYQTTHHGLEASNNPVVLASLEPTVAVMNNGARKGSDPQTVATLKESKTLRAVYQLHKNVRDGGRHNVAPEARIANQKEKCDGAHIHLRVAADGKSYTVRVPSTGHEERFEVQQR